MFTGKKRLPEAARHSELERALKRLARGAAPAEVVESMSRRLANKLLHEPTVRLHDLPGEFA